MPTFFFDIQEGDLLARDDEGTELPDIKAARTVALQTLPDIVGKHRVDSDQYDLSVDVRDGAGKHVFTANLSMVAEPADDTTYPIEGSLHGDEL